MKTIKRFVRYTALCPVLILLCRLFNLIVDGVNIQLSATAIIILVVTTLIGAVFLRIAKYLLARCLVSTLEEGVRALENC